MVAVDLIVVVVEVLVVVDWVDADVEVVDVVSEQAANRKEVINKQITVK